jgi:hypothetical protein
MPYVGSIMSGTGKSKSKASGAVTTTKAKNGTKLVRVRRTPVRTPGKKKTAVAFTPATGQPAKIADILQEQYDLPVTFDVSGKVLTLKQLLQAGSCALSLSSLEHEKLVELTSQRIAAQPDFEIAMVGAGLVNKARALKEIAAQTDVGRLLVEIEQRVIQRVLNRAIQ